MRLPGSQDVERVGLSTPPSLTPPAQTGGGEALEAVGIALAGAAFRQQDRVEAEAERQQRLNDAIAINRATESFNQRANEAFTTWQVEADTTQPEAFRSFNEQLAQLRKDVTGVLPQSMSEEARVALDGQLGTWQQAFSEDAGRVYTASLQNVAIESINGQINQYTMQAMTSPDRIEDIFDLAAEGLSMFNGTLGTAKEKEIMNTAGAAIYQAAISGYLGSDRIADAEKLLNDPKYGHLLTPEQRFTVTNRIAAFREAAASMNAVDSLVTEALAATDPGAGGFVQMVTAAESGGNPNATNAASSATGAGQFLDATWLGLMRDDPRAAEKSEAEILALRTDPAISAEMVEKYGAQNAAVLRNAGLPVDNGTLYLAHFAGPQGAVALLEADPETPVKGLLSDEAIAANPEVLNGKTAGEVIAWARGKMAGAAGTGVASLNLTVEEQNLWNHHARNLATIGTGGVQNADGSISTVRQMVVTGPGGRYYSIPSVWNGKILSEEEARLQAEITGWDKWPSYATPEEADARYQQMHRFMEGPGGSGQAQLDPATRLQAGLDYIRNAQGVTEAQKRDAEAQLLTQHNRDVALKQIETDQLYQTAINMVWEGKGGEISVAMRADLEQAGLWDAIGAEMYDYSTGAQQHTDWQWMNGSFLNLSPAEQAAIPLAEIKAHTDRETFDKIVAARATSEAPFYSQSTADYIDSRLAPLGLDPKKNPDDQKALDLFHRAYDAEVSAWQEKNGQQAPEGVLREIVDRLTGEIAIQGITEGWFDDNIRELRGFEIYDPGNEDTVAIAEQTGIPAELLPDVLAALQRRGLPVTADNLRVAYEAGVGMAPLRGF